MKKLTRVFILYLVLLLSLGIAANVYELRNPIEDFWQLWCHNWFERIGDLFFGASFLGVGFAMILFPKKIEQELMQNEDADDIRYWGLRLVGLFIIWPGVDILLGLFRNWFTYCS